MSASAICTNPLAREVILPTFPSTRQAHHSTGPLRPLPSSPVPGQTYRLHPDSTQSPYIHRASDLLQIAVSTLLRTGSIGIREVLHAEHCRYGTRDFSRFHGL